MGVTVRVVAGGGAVQQHGAVAVVSGHGSAIVFEQLHEAGCCIVVLDQLRAAWRGAVVRVPLLVACAGSGLLGAGLGLLDGEALGCGGHAGARAVLNVCLKRRYRGLGIAVYLDRRRGAGGD